jgi:simple sugar transport system ATP-binding protein
LCNIVFGVHRADAGAMRFAGVPYRPAGPAEALRAGVAMVHQHFSLVPDLSVVDNLLLGQARGFLRGARSRRGDAAVRGVRARGAPARDRAGPVGRRAPAGRDRQVPDAPAAPARASTSRPRCCCLPRSTACCSVCERVARSGCGIVLVTHKLAEIRRTAHRVTVLRLGRVVTQLR